MSSRRLFLSFFGSGYIGKAPGTVGSLAAVLVALPILHYFGSGVLFSLTIAITIVGIFEINAYEKSEGIHDPSWIVIDEVAGMWLALLLVQESIASASFAYAEITGVLLAFGAFRLFDIRKPSTIGTIDRKLKGGLGVMLDDIVAGIAGGLLAAVVLTAIRLIDV